MLKTIKILWIVLCGNWMYGQGYRIEERIEVSTYAGSGVEGFVDGKRLHAQMASPNGISMDRFGNLFIADSKNHAIRKVTTLGELYTFAGSGLQGHQDGFGTNAQFAFPTDAYADKNGNVYVADYWNHCIRKITPYGLVFTIAGVPGKAGYKNGTAKQALFNHPIGVIVDYTDNLFVLDTENHCVRRISNEGEVSTFVGYPEPGFQDGYGTSARFDTPTGLCADRYGNFYLVDAHNRAIRKIHADGLVETLLDHRFSYFKDSTGGKSLAFFNADHSGGGICSGPKDIFFIADGASHTIYKVDVQRRVISVLAGTGKKGYKDGEAPNALFDEPVELTMDPSNNIYVADFGNHVVRKIEFRKIKVPLQHSKELPVYYLAGNITDAETHKPISEVEVILQMYEGDDLVKKKHAAQNGHYRIPIAGGTYQIFVKVPGYMPYQAELQVPNQQHVQHAISLIPIKKGAKAILRNIYFAPNSATLTVDAIEGLDKLVDFMKLNPTISLQINGHTDIGSTQDYNLKLSTQRAKAVRNYLVQMGIESYRIQYKGFGNSVPIADNKTPEGRAQNRRIEIEITGL